MKMRKIFSLFLAVLLLSSCAPKQVEAPVDEAAESKAPVCPGEPMLIAIDSRISSMSSMPHRYGEIVELKRLTRTVPFDCFLREQPIVRPLYQVTVYWLEDGQEVCYALRAPVIGAPDLTKEERLELERQMQAYAKERGKQYSYLYCHGFAVFAFTNEEPQLWVRAARRAYNESPEFGRDIEESEVMSQHQIVFRLTLAQMFAETEWTG